MHLTSALVASCIGTVVAASPVDSRPRYPDGMLVAHSHERIDLDFFESIGSNSTSLEKRTPWEVCWKSTAHTDNCIKAGAAGVTAAIAIAALVVTASNNHDCSYHSGQSEGISYQVHATGSGGCSTTAQEDTVAGGLKAYFDANDGQICEVRCLDQSHGGSYDGYLKIGPLGADLSQYKCDSSIVFPNSSCTKGGKNTLN